MILFPAIDLLGGSCVRLVKGEYGTAHQVAESPLEAALGFYRAGAKALHMVDLDGAKGGVGSAQNRSAVAEICGILPIPVELGGGIRTLLHIEKALALGVARVILGSAATDLSFLAQALSEFGEKIAVGLDVREGYIATSGWTETSSLPYLEFAQQAQSLGCKTMIANDISRDGTLCGPGIQMLRALQKAVPGVMLIASGGIRDLTDILALKDLGIYGAICGKSLYAGTLDLQEALEAAGQQNA